jgi:S-adenosylmethionine:tRNA ribosyltransferase-isomerase
MQTDFFDYDLPPDRIAQVPLPRGESRLMVLNRPAQTIEHRQFTDILEYLNAGDTLVLNDTRVSARRVSGVRDNGGEMEILLLHAVDDRHWNALLKPARRVKIGSLLTLHEGDDSVCATIVGINTDGSRLLEFESLEDSRRIADWGQSPLPPYIGTALARDQEERYQTVYSAHLGSAAAPTAGLHFTPELLSAAEAKGTILARVTLHVGVDTFRPVKVDDTDAHEMHGETFTLSEQAAETINSTQGKVVAVGTTSVRVLETAARWKQEQQPNAAGRVIACQGESRLFLTPGSSFHATDALLTNFHLPRSTLIMLVSAFASSELIRRAYQAAIEENYRFYSFGDAMFIY